MTMNPNETTPAVPKLPTARKKRSFWGITWKVLAALAAVGTTYALLKPKALVVEVAPATTGVLLVTVSEEGHTRLKDRYVVSSPVSGNLGRIELHAGDDVNPGQVLARLVPLRAPLLDSRTRGEAEARVAMARATIQQTQAQIERARVARTFAESEVTREKQLVERGAISSAQYERTLLEQRSRDAELTSALFGAKVAEHEWNMARAALGQLTSSDTSSAFEIPSPTAGRILRVVHESEGVVQAGTALLELGDPRALEVVVDVLTQDAVNIRAGLPATLTHWGGADVPAHVRLVEPSAFTRQSALGVEEQRVNVVLELNGAYETWAALGDGYRVEATIELRRRPGVVMPASALFRQGDGWATFVVAADRAQLRTVVVADRNDREVLVESGVQPAERVVLHPNPQLRDGGLVTFERN